MPARRTAIASALRIAALFMSIFGAILLARDLTFGTSAIAAALASVQRIIAVAFKDGPEMGWLVLMCAGAGLFVLADRRRRAKVRQASS